MSSVTETKQDNNREEYDQIISQDLSRSLSGSLANGSRLYR